MPRQTVQSISLASILLAAVGCARDNSGVSVSSPSVYTHLHIAAVPDALSIQSDSFSETVPFRTVSEELQRYFRQPETINGGAAKPEYLRLDNMIDDRQRVSSLAQLLAKKLTVDAQL